MLPGTDLERQASVPLSSACRGESCPKREDLQRVAVLDTRRRGMMKCGAGGRVCMMSSPTYFVIAPSVSVSGRGREGEGGERKANRF